MVFIPEETKEALIWAEQQTYEDRGGYIHEITFDEADAQPLMDKTTEYFAEHNTEYGTFGYNDVRYIIDEILAEQQPEEPIEESTEGPAE
jgi:hypothetical protein